MPDDKKPKQPADATIRVDVSINGQTFLQSAVECPVLLLNKEQTVSRIFTEIMDELQEAASDTPRAQAEMLKALERSMPVDDVDVEGSDV